MAVAAGLEDHAARALINLGTIAAEVRDYRHARPDLDRALAFVQASELAGYVQHVLGYRARMRLDLGDWAGAEQDARAALAEPVKGGAMVVGVLVPLGLLQARRGDPDAVATLQEATEAAFATDELQWTGPVAAARAEHAWLAGDDRRVVEEAAPFELAVQDGSPLVRRGAGLLVAARRRAGSCPGGDGRATPAAAGRRLARGRRRLAAARLSVRAGLGVGLRRPRRGFAGGAGAAGRLGRPADGPAAAGPALPPRPGRRRAARRLSFLVAVCTLGPATRLANRVHA